MVSRMCRCGSGREMCMSSDGRSLSVTSLSQADVAIACYPIHFSNVAVDKALSNDLRSCRSTPSSSSVRV